MHISFATLKRKCHNLCLNFLFWLLQKLSKWHLLVQQVMEISSKYWHFRFSVRKRNKWPLCMCPNHAFYGCNWIILLATYEHKCNGDCRVPSNGQSGPITVRPNGASLVCLSHFDRSSAWKRVYSAPNLHLIMVSLFHFSNVTFWLVYVGLHFFVQKRIYQSFSHSSIILFVVSQLTCINTFDLVIDSDFLQNNVYVLNCSKCPLKCH